MASFQAKIGWKRLRKRKNKNLFGFISSQNRMEKTEKEREQKLSFRFVLNRRAIENSKKIAKKFKKLKNTIMASFHAEIVCNSPRKKKNKNYRSVPFLPNLQ